MKMVVWCLGAVVMTFCATSKETVKFKEVKNYFSIRHTVQTNVSREY